MVLRHFGCGHYGSGDGENVFGISVHVRRWEKLSGKRKRPNLNFLSHQIT